MAFINASLLAGGLMVSIPIILHFVMRQQPKVLEFPAIRFIQKRQESNKRRLRVKQWLLLLLRCLAIACFAAALARPSVTAASIGNWIIVGALTVVLLLVGAALTLAVTQKRGGVLTGVLIGVAALLLIGDGYMLTKALGQSDSALLGDQEAPVAAVLVVDTSPRMAYRFENETRLEKAQRMADWLLRQLPDESDVAILDARPQRRVFSIDLAAAANALDRLDVSTKTQSLTSIVAEAFQLTDTSRKNRKEIYVFTDLTQSAWDPTTAEDLRRRLQAAPDVQIYIVDVGVEAPENLALGNLQIPFEAITKNSKLEVRTEVAALGKGGKATVQLRIEKPDPSRPRITDGKALLPVAQPRQQHSIEIPENGKQLVSFSVAGLDVGVHHGEIELQIEDGLIYDNKRHFVVRVSEAWSVLILRPPGGTYVNFTEAIAPYLYRQQDRAPFQYEVVDAGDLPTKKLRDYDAVVLLDPQPLTEDLWDRLYQYATNGGGLAVFLGHNARKDGTFASEAAQKVIGGRLRLVWRSPEGQFLVHRQSTHPVLAKFKTLTSVPWEQFPVFRHWSIDPLADSAQVILSYSASRKPAMIELQPGTGRILCMTTPISDPLTPDGRDTWNEVAAGSDNWPYFVMINEAMRYLVKGDETKLNYAAGEVAVLHNDSRTDPVRYQLFSPRGELRNLAAQDDRISVRSTDQPGAYRLKGERGEVVLRGFAVNLPSKTTDLTRLTREDLGKILGTDRFQYARSQEQIVFGVREERVGREFYPVLMILLALFLGLEHLLANRFYKRED